MPDTTKIGYFLSCEEQQPHELVRQAKLAEQAGFDALWISDHYHPWNDEQGSSPFVWSVIGAIAEATDLPITTAVTCPTIRTHPAVIAQAAATSAVLAHGKFILGIGAGENLNEHILGDPWPPAGIRQDMLAESVEVMRALWEGKLTTHRGTYYKVDNARLYTLPDSPVPVYVSAFGPQAAELAGRIGDGLISTMPDSSLIEAFRKAGGEGKPAQAGFKVCWGADEAEARKTAHRLWANEQLPGQLAQELRLPSDFGAAQQLVTEEMIGDSIVCGPDVDRHVAAFQPFTEAGYDEVYVNQIGPDADAFFDAYGSEVLPRLRRSQQ